MNKRQTFKHRFKHQAKFNGLECYGKRIKVSKYTLQAANLFLAVIIPIVYPVPLAMVINRWFKSITLRVN